MKATIEFLEVTENDIGNAVCQRNDDSGRYGIITNVAGQFVNIMWMTEDASEDHIEREDPTDLIWM